MKKSTLIFTIIIANMLSGCDVLEDKNTTEPLDSNLLFNVSESFNDYSEDIFPSIYLNLSSEKIYGCMNNSINSMLNSNGNIISIDVIGIVVPDVCLTALGPATKRFKLDLREGEYQIIFNVNGKQNQFSLNITKDLIEVKEIKSSAVFCSINKTARFPEKSMAYLCGTTVDMKFIEEDFLDTLKSVIELTEITFPADCQIPFPDSSSGYWHNNPAKYFIYKSESDFDKIKEVLSLYKQNHFAGIDGIGISFYNWRNKYIYSWTL